MLQNAPTLAIVAVDTDENERLKFGVIYSVYSYTFLVIACSSAAVSEWCRGTSFGTRLAFDSRSFAKVVCVSLFHE